MLDFALKSMRKAVGNAKRPHEEKKREARGRPWFSLMPIFEKMRSIDNETCSEVQLRDKAIVLLAIDLAGRASDVARAIRTSLVFSPTAVMLTLAATKNARDSRNTNVTVQAYPDDPRICTVHALRAWQTRFPARENDRLAADADGTQYLPLFPCVTSKRKAKGNVSSQPSLPRDPLSSQRIAKVILAVLPQPATGERWSAHNVRGAVASKWDSLGAMPITVAAGGRWATYESFAKSYRRPVLYINRPPNAAVMSTAALARWPGERAHN